MQLAFVIAFAVTTLSSASIGQLVPHPPGHPTRVPVPIDSEPSSLRPGIPTHIPWPISEDDGFDIDVDDDTDISPPIRLADNDADPTSLIPMLPESSSISLISTPTPTSLTQMLPESNMLSATTQASHHARRGETSTTSVLESPTPTCYTHTTEVYPTTACTAEPQCTNKKCSRYTKVYQPCPVSSCSVTPTVTTTKPCPDRCATGIERCTTLTLHYPPVGCTAIPDKRDGKKWDWYRQNVHRGGGEMNIKGGRA